MTEQIDSKAGDTESPGAAALSRPSAVSSVEQLVAARQAAGLGASDIASRMGMATRQIEALERGDWKALPGQAFVRAGLRAYGKSLGVDVEPLLASIGGQVSAPELRASASLESPIPRGGGFGFGSSGSSGRLAWIILGVAAVIAIVFYFGPAFELGQRSANGDVALVPPPAGQAGSSPAAGNQGAPSTGAPVAAGTAGSAASAASPASPALGVSAGGPTSAAPSGSASLAPLTPLAPLAPAGSAGPSAAPAAGAASAPSAAGPAAGPAAATAGSAAGATSPPAAQVAAPAGTASAAGESPAPAASSDTDTLRLRFGRESWVEIREAGGKVILTGLQPAGSERELSGRKPLTLVIGNAEHVTLERGGKAVDLAARARQGVARLTLD